MDKFLKRSQPGPSTSSSQPKVFKISESELNTVGGPSTSSYGSKTIQSDMKTVGSSSEGTDTPTERDVAPTSRPTQSSKSTAKVIKKEIRRKYDPSYLAFGFTYTGDLNEPTPQCVICMETLSKHSMKPSLLMRHFNTKHHNLKGKPVAYFKNKESELKGSKNTMSSFSSLNTRAVEASYKVSLRIAQEAKPHTIGESLILPAAKDMVSSILGEKEAKLLDVVSLSNNTVTRRVKDMALDVKRMLIEKIKKSPYFSLQIDETTDITNMPNLLCYVRYEDSNRVNEDMLFCEILPTHTTGEDIFVKLNGFINEHDLDWNKCVGLCTDGAAAMVGRHSGVVARVKQVATQATFTHCCLHREALVSKNCPESLKKVLSQAVKTVNFIKARALHSRLFAILCDDMGSLHRQLLLHTEVRWLSRGKVLTRLFELRNEVFVFLSDKNFEFKDCFADELWMSRLVYLAEIFSKLNELNQSLQGNNNTPFRVNDKVSAMKKKLNQGAKEAEEKKISLFPTLESFVDENDIQLSPEFLADIKNHCLSLINSYNLYFPEDLNEYSWIQNPFAEIEMAPDNLTAPEKEQLFELNCDSELRQQFSRMMLVDFWVERRVDYGQVADKAVKFLLPFSTSYLCETAFSSLVYLKNKYRNRLLNVENDLRLRLSNLRPDIPKLASKIQAQPSH
ncbi:zinc finger BED domain-containing protein 5-like [Macrosteles quadrilineatus]|uniref:zinc finger BED domain-containing protein 5-like n=1 Tax=Macrosteles quadrilineatus TaxID=74068 RepID=UPI0023E1514E|nr:zinc finger BED domain-containing protein 5-like [Macrosteles quadrilineatus]